MIYTIPIRFEFDGTVRVRAENKTAARAAVVLSMRAKISKINTSRNEHILEYNVQPLSYAKEIEKIMQLLEEGKMIHVNHCDMWLSPGKEYIRWNSFGSSANRKTFRDLDFILREIAEYDGTQHIYINENRSIYEQPELTQI